MYSCKIFFGVFFVIFVTFINKFTDSEKKATEKFIVFKLFGKTATKFYPNLTTLPT